MRQLLLCCALALAALAARAEVIDIDSAQLAQMTKNGVTVIDIRTKPEWEETGIVPGSKLLTFFDERGKADPAQKQRYRDQNGQDFHYFNLSAFSETLIDDNDMASAAASGVAAPISARGTAITL